MSIHHAPITVSATGAIATLVNPIGERIHAFEDGDLITFRNDDSNRFLNGLDSCHVLMPRSIARDEWRRYTSSGWRRV